MQKRRERVGEGERAWVGAAGVNEREVGDCIPGVVGSGVGLGVGGDWAELEEGGMAFEVGRRLGEEPKVLCSEAFASLRSGVGEVGGENGGGRGLLAPVCPRAKGEGRNPGSLGAPVLAMILPGPPGNILDRKEASLETPPSRNFWLRTLVLLLFRVGRGSGGSSASPSPSPPLPAPPRSMLLCT